MDTECLPFREIPGTSRLFLDFLSGSPKIRPYYPSSRLSLDALAESAKSVSIASDRREQVADILLRQNQAWGCRQATTDNIEKLRRGAAAIVTGQQVGLFLGPAYTLQKLVSVLRLAREVSSRGTEAVPVFWLASEDHDLAEVNHIYLPDQQGEFRRLETKSHGSASQPVGGIPLADDVTALVQEIESIAGPSQVLDAVKESYRPGESLAGAFARLVTQLFSALGLIVLEPSDPAIHRLAAPVLASAVTQSEELTKALIARSRELENAGYHAQVKVTQASTLLFALECGARTAVHRKNGGFSANGEHWTEEALLSAIHEQPERFTPNALLRPVVQDYLLPTATYIAGPAEAAYFAQSQAIYEKLLDRTTPVWPRFSVTLIEARLASWMGKYKLHLRDLLRPADDFRRELAHRIFPTKTEQAFEAARVQLDHTLAPLLADLARLDPTIAAAGETSARKMRYQLDRLQSRAALAHLRREQVLERHARMLSAMLYPDRQLQERHIGSIYFLAKFGSEIIDRLIEDYRPECHDHQVLEIG